MQGIWSGSYYGHTVVLSSSALTIKLAQSHVFLGINNMLTNKFETNEDGTTHRGCAEANFVVSGQEATAVQRFL